MGSSLQFWRLEVSKDKQTSVEAAFEILLEEMEAEVELVNDVITRAAGRNDYARVREMVDRAEELTSLRDRVAGLRSDWSSAVDDLTEDEEQEVDAGERRDLGRLKRGLRTPEEAFFGPILSVIDARGGSVRTSVVVDNVLPFVKDQLKDVDYEPIRSDPNRPRWRNTAHWARNSMVEQGLLKDDSPRGVWEISDKGRRWLADHRKS